MANKKHTIEVEITSDEAVYIRLVAFNRFLDNIRRALHGDEECKQSLLGEDLADMRHYLLPVYTKVQNEINTKLWI